MLLFIMFLGIGQMWGADPQDTYYKFSATASSKAVISPVSGESNNKITLGTNSASKVSKTTGTLLGTSYTHRLECGGTDVTKGFTLDVSASADNPAHIYIVSTSGSDRTLTCKFENNKIKEWYARNSIIEFVTTNNGAHTFFGSGTFYIHEIRVLYEKNDNFAKRVVSGDEIHLDVTQEYDANTSEFMFFNPIDITVGSGYFELKSTSSLKYTISFTPRVDGTLTMKLKSTSNGRSVYVKPIKNDLSFDNAIATFAITSEVKEYKCNVSKGQPYVITASGSACQLSDLKFAPSTYTVTYDANGGSGTTTDDDKYKKDAPVTLKENAFTAPTGEKFDNWLVDNNIGVKAEKETFTMPNANVKVTAQWKWIDYTITCTGDDYGTVSASGTPHYGETITLNIAPKSDGYELNSLTVKDDNNTDVQVSDDYKFTMPASKVAVTATFREKLQEFDISFANGGHGTAPSTKTASNVTLAAITGVTGYTCTGWTADVDVKVGGKTVSAGTSIENGTNVIVLQNTTFTAQWETNKYTLTWGFGESGSTTDENYTKAGQVAYNTSIIYPANNTMSRQGYIFTGWDKEVTTMPADNLTITALWEKNEYTVIYKDGIKELGTEKVAVGSQPTANDIETAKAHYTFSGWEPALNDVSAAKDETVTVNAQYTGVYAVTADFAAKATELGAKGSGNLITSFLSERDYTFNVSTANSAEFDVNHEGYHGYKFKNNGDWIEFLVKKGDHAKIYIMYTDIGWDILVDGTKKYSNVTEKSKTTDLCAIKEIYDDTKDIVIKLVNNSANGKTSTLNKIEIVTPAPKHDVFFAAGDGGQSSMDPVKVAEGSEYTAPECGFTATKKQFDKWSVTGVEGVSVVAAGGTFTMPAGDVTLTALWNDLYSVTYDLNDGTGTLPSEQDHIQDATFNVAVKGDIAKEGFDFMGWNDGEKTYAGGAEYKMPNHNVTLTAQWAVAVTKYTVTYYDGNTPLGTEEVREGDAPTASEIETDKQGFIFQNWCSDPELQNDVVLSELSITQATPLYAKYARAYAETIDLVALAQKYGAKTQTNIVEELAAKNYSISSIDNVTWDYNSNVSDCGLKVEDEVRTISFWVRGDQLVKIKVGTLAGVNSGTAELSKDGGSTYEDIVGANPQGTGDPVEHICYVSNETQFILRSKQKTDKLIWSVLQSVTIDNPYKLTFDATTNGGEAIDPMYYHAEPMTLPTAVNGEKIFNGWWDASTGGTQIGVAGEEISITEDKILYAQFVDESAEARLSAITLSAGELTPAFDKDVYSYTVTMPYGTKDIPQISSVTVAESHATYQITQAEAWDGNATVVVTAQDKQSQKTYTITMNRTPKDGICIIKATQNGTGNTADVDGLLKGSAYYNGQAGSKLGSNGHYVGVELKSGETFKAGDMVNFAIGATNDATQVQYNIAASADNAVKVDHAFVDNEVYTFEIPAMAIGQSKFYIYRIDSKCNPNVKYLEVTRAMNPMLTKATILGEEATINESAKTVKIEVPFSSDITAVTPEFEFVSNDNTQVVVTPAGAQNFTEAKTYRFTDKDGDYTEYTVTLTKAAASSDATLKSLSVTGYSLTFAPETLNYTIERAYKDRDAALPEISYEVNYSAATAVESPEGKVVTITVTAEDGTTQKAYTITFTNKAASTDATLASLKYGETAIELEDGVYEYDVELPYGTTEVPHLTAPTHYLYAHADINNATAFENYAAISTVVVTAEDGETTLTYTVNFSVDKFPSIVIFDGSTMTSMKASPDATTGLSWGTTGISMSQADKTATYEGVSYTKALTLGTTSATKYFSITVPENYEAKIHILMMTNNSSSTRSAWITSSADKGTKEDAIMSVTSTSYSDLGDGTTDWLDEGTYYVHTDNSINFFVISVKMKKNAPKPTIESITEDGTYCEGSDMPTLTVNATVTEGTMHYQWYKGSVKVGTGNASYTPTEDGTYHVVITNKMDGFDDGVVTSDDVVVASVSGTAITATQGGMARANTAVTISVTATGKNLNYAWYACDKQGNISGDQLGNEESLNVTVAADNTYYKVIVNGDCGEEQSAVIKVETVPEIAPQVSVSATTVWDFSKAPKDADDAASDGIKSTEANQVMANISNIRLDDTFNSQALVMGNAGEYAYRSGSNKCFQGKSLKFNTTVPGMVTINARSASGSVNLTIGSTDFGTIDNNKRDYSAYVEAGDVEILATGDQTVRIFTMTFTAADHSRLGMKLDDLGTICLPYNVPVENQHGADFFKIDYQDGSFVHFIEETGELQAGMPYVFQVTGKDVALFSGEEYVDAPLSEGTNGMYGTFENIPVGPFFNNLGAYMINTANNHITKCGTKCSLKAYRAYFIIEEMPTSPQQIEVPAGQAAPRRLVLGRDKANTPTDLNAVFFNGNTVQKVIFNNNVRIIRNGVIYDAVGRRIK